MIYNDGKIKVRKAEKSDIEHIASNMRESDIEEIWASHHEEPKKALESGLESSIFACTIENGVPIAMFGICPYNIIGDTASIWMLATDDLNKMKKTFVKNNKKIIDIMLEYYPILENYVDARNEQSIKWLKLCGAEMDEPVPFGVEQLPFRHFTFRRK